MRWRYANHIARLEAEHFGLPRRTARRYVTQSSVPSSRRCISIMVVRFYTESSRRFTDLPPCTVRPNLGPSVLKLALCLLALFEMHCVALIQPKRLIGSAITRALTAMVGCRPTRRTRAVYRCCLRATPLCFSHRFRLGEFHRPDQWRKQVGHLVSREGTRPPARIWYRPGGGRRSRGSEAGRHAAH